MIPSIPFPVQELPGKAQQRRFTIITATFNSGDLFERTANSLNAQRFTNFEWIVVDGGSQDDTVQRIKSHAEQITYWISEPDRGIADAWNKGLMHSRGAYILILNAGDTYDSEFLHQVDAHIGDGRRVVGSHARLIANSGRTVGVIKSEPHKLYRAMHLAHNWCAVPRLYYHQLGGFAELKLGMDFEWFHRFYRIYGVDGFTIINLAMGEYHLGGTSDVNYAASFRTNADILRSHGTPNVIAQFWRLAYTAKHAWRTRRLREHAT